MISDRLTYTEVEPCHLDDFHGLVQDEHVRRYLLDGQVFSRMWSAERIGDSQALFEQRRLGIWLVHEKTSKQLVGFCGFLIWPSVHPEPQLVYAMFERFTGKGYAIEMARAAIARARHHAGLREIIVSVDEINVASHRILEKLGFEWIETQKGQFGKMFLLRLKGTPTESEDTAI